MINTYSQTWFNLFLDTQLYTEQEVAFVMRNLPNPPCRCILDVACGPGRHALPLAKNGYEVVGIDLDEAAVFRANQNARDSATFLQMDMRSLEKVPGTFDAVICMWQSFGYFDEATNRDVLRQMGEKVGRNGRIILDIYNRPYFEQPQSIRHAERKGVEVTITNQMKGNRLTAQLEYSDGSQDDIFEWQLYSSEEITKIANEFGLQCVFACTECDENKPVTEQRPRMQLVFEKN
ncbi:MAG: class I SAM-dependent methyltransferase [Chloroflexi bacterium]|nr:MAG: class I SAM-dependent methyltransferase [Chloroflexota bacterium]